MTFTSKFLDIPLNYIRNETIILHIHNFENFVLIYISLYFFVSLSINDTRKGLIVDYKVRHYESHLREINILLNSVIQILLASLHPVIRIFSVKRIKMRHMSILIKINHTNYNAS